MAPPSPKASLKWACSLEKLLCVRLGEFKLDSKVRWFGASMYVIVACQTFVSIHLDVTSEIRNDGNYWATRQDRTLAMSIDYSEMSCTTLNRMPLSVSMAVCCTAVCVTSTVLFAFLLFYVLATYKVISGRVPTCDSTHYWRLYSGKPWPAIPLSHIMLTMSQPVFVLS